MHLDTADLAALWVDAENLDPLACGIVRALIDRINEDEADVERHQQQVEDMRGEAEDAATELSKLLSVDGWEELPAAADSVVHDVELCLERIIENKDD